MFERPKLGEKALLVHVDFRDNNVSENLSEFEELAYSAGASVVDIITSSRSVPCPKFYVGSGKADEIAARAKECEAELILFNHALSPSQERNLEKHLQLRVLDRTGLILDIFAQRARTHEGKLQVELAQLQHIASRLVRGWTHLERQKGGIGLRGPGETQLETDRRLIRRRIDTIQNRLEKIRCHRDQTRRSRQRADMPTVALVGYTNAGKSTLFNALSSAEVYVANQLFATLDPTFRQVQIPSAGAVILADTVGFIRHLPHHLVEAFRATLEETQNADLLLHVMDISDPELEAHAEQVENVLTQLGADKIPRLIVYNKIDEIEAAEPGIDYNGQHQPFRARVSALKQVGLDSLRKAIAERLHGAFIYRTITISPLQSQLRAKLYDMHAVMEESPHENGGFILAVRMTQRDFKRMFPEENDSSDGLSETI